MNRAALIVGRRGPGTIHLPAGELLAGPFVPNQISPTEGTTIILTAAMSGITWQGHSTVFKLISNRVAVFEIDGATNSKFRSIKFDNSEHGYLNHNPGSATGGPGLGVAANGNAANCAIRQWTGANLTAWDCDFVAMHSGVQYIGNYLDIAQLVGTADVQNCRFDGCAMGFLPSQAEHVVCNGNRWLNGWDSFRPAPGAPGAVAPGHMLYITNSAGAAPYTVVANNNYARHCSASVLKMRKGIAQTCLGNVFEGVQGGIECHNAKNTTITGNTIKLQLWPTNRIPLGRPESEGYAAGDGTAATAIVVSGCYGGGVVANNTIDKAGHAGYAIRIRAADLAEDPEGEVEDGQYPRNLHVHDNTISDSCEEIMIQTRPDIDGDPLPPMSVAPIAPWMLLTHLTDCIVENNVLHITADVDSEQWMIRADLCERTKFLNNSRTNPFLSEGSDRIIMLGSGCSNCVVGTRMEDIPIADTGPMVSDSGTNTRRLYTDGILIEEWTPVPSFETLGDFDPVITHAEGWIERQGQVATVGGNLAFDTNAYSLPGAGGPDGFFKILFPYELRNASGGVYNAVGYHSRFAIPTDSMGVAMHAHENFLTLRYNQTGTDGARLTTAHIPPSTLAVEVNFQIRVNLQPSGPFDHVILPETQKLLDAGWTPSTTTVLQRVDKCIRDLKSYGLWDKILACWGKNSLLNWKNPGTYTMVPVGAPLFIEDDYFSGTGTNTDYYLTGLNLATQGAGLYTLNAASMWRWSDTDLLSDTAADMGNDAKSLVHGMTLAGQLQCFTNSAIASLAPVEHSTGLAGWTRTDAANVILFKSRDSTPGSAASTSIQSAPLRIGHGGVGGSGSARRLKFAGVGGALTAEELLQLERVINNYAQF